MSEGEQKLVDTGGDFLYLLKNGRPLEEPRWESCKIILTNERLVLSLSSGKQSIHHDKIRRVDLEASETDVTVSDDIDIASATPLRIGESVVLIDAQGIDDFESEYSRAVLYDEVILVKYPAVVGGVVQSEAEWSKARFRLDDDTVKLGLPGNQTVSFDVEDVGTIESGAQQVLGEQRTVLRIEHTNDQDQSVETHFSGTQKHARALESLLETVIHARESEHELSETEKEILMALYSGISPFDIADFVGVSIDEVEEIYTKLIEIGALDRVRVRTEVALNAHGRNLASDAMNEQ